MNEQLRQSLSAVVDGEADAFELRRVLDELDRDAQLRATWTRYHLIGSVMRGEHSALRGASADRLRQPIAVSAGRAGARLADVAAASEDPVATRARGIGPRAAVLTVATAFVAVSALLSGLLLTSANRESESGSVTQAQEPGSQTFASDAAFDAEALGPSRADEQWVRAYMLQHAQQQGLDQRGVISLVRPATYSVP